MDDQALLELCNKYLVYDSITGIMTNKITRGSRAIKGDLSGNLDPSGYWRIRLNGQRYLTHRLAFLMKFHYMPKEIDHINGDSKDNRITNLRECTRAQNVRNGKVRGASKFKGVSWDKGRRKWIAQIVINKKSIKLGGFEDEELAHNAYLCAARNYNVIDFVRANTND